MIPRNYQERERERENNNKCTGGFNKRQTSTIALIHDSNPELTNSSLLFLSLLFTKKKKKKIHIDLLHRIEVSIPLTKGWKSRVELWSGEHTDYAINSGKEGEEEEGCDRVTLPSLPSWCFLWRRRIYNEAINRGQGWIVERSNFPAKRWNESEKRESLIFIAVGWWIL